MEDRQRKLAKNLGNDTHTRNIEDNMFQSQSVNTLKVVTGEVFLTQPEPLFSQTNVMVNLTKGGLLSSVAYPNAFKEPISGNIHGLYEGPIPGQMVMLGFVEGNSASPFVINRYPYQGQGNSLTELAYINPLTQSLYNATDVILGHVSGSYLSFNTGFPIPTGKLPGSVSLHSMTDLKIDTLAGIIDISSSLTMNLTSTLGMNIDAGVAGALSVKGLGVDVDAGASALTMAGLGVDIDASAGASTIAGLTVELNGNTKAFVTWAELNAALQILITALGVPLIVTGVATPALAVSGTAAWAVPPTLDISSAQTTTVKTGG